MKYFLIVLIILAVVMTGIGLSTREIDIFYVYGFSGPSYPTMIEANAYLNWYFNDVRFSIVRYVDYNFDGKWKVADWSWQVWLTPEHK